MNATRRSLCIVSSDPLQCGELVLSLQASLEPEDEVEIVVDRRLARDVFGTESRKPDPRPVDRRRNPDVDLAVRTKGFAIVRAAPLTGSAPEGQDAEELARFENILSFKRRHESRAGRVVGAASAVVIALILTPPLNGFSDRVARDVPSSAEVAKPEPSVPAPRAGGIEHPSLERTAPSLTRPNPPPTRTTHARPTPAKHRSSSNGVIEEYTARVEDAAERVVSRAKSLFDRVKSEVIGGAPTNIGPEPPDNTHPVAVKRRPADSQ